MEKTVSAERDLVLWAIEEAGKPGDVVVPAALLAAAEADPSPIAALADMGRCNALFNALTEGWDFIPLVRATQKQPTQDVRERLAGLLRWTVRALRNWHPDSDPRRAVLVSIFVITRYCEYAGPIWPRFPPEAANEDLLLHLSTMLPSLRLELSPWGFSRAPITEGEAIASFNRADEAGDWAALASQLLHIDLRMTPTTLTSQSVRYLQRFDQGRLESVATAVRQTTLMMQVLEPLTDVEACELALASSNPYCEFAAMYKSVAPLTRRDEPDDSPERCRVLSRLFVKVAQDDARWRQWMFAFNRYPQRFSRVSVPLGQALASVPDTALAPYIDSIELTAMSIENTAPHLTRGSSRGIVAEAQEAFHAMADQDRRKRLWSLAHDRWKKWNFGREDELSASTGIMHCALDYALVGYAAECMSEGERRAALNDIRRQLSSLALRWFKSVVAFGEAKYLLLSHMQPYAHATTQPNEWLAANDYVPYDVNSDRYAALMLGVI